ncbi:AraC family transcriptional regulator [Cohnella abietis]|uniref:HTH-type transcriptional activator Btr n=1 Tax=Cohnella abietis TaxID=2507935 RepID=A0A3T1D668_9BACL|nr:AraC family transcriptional regulator [Cohnella abietis]BBI33559.1 hypothetical protein KCTCHS21_29580 [Cohnella abietis]
MLANEYASRTDDQLLSRKWFKLMKIESVLYSGNYWSFKREIVERNLFIIATGERDRVVIDGHPVMTYPGMVLACKPGQQVEIGVSSEDGHMLYLLYYEMGSLNDDRGNEQIHKDGLDLWEAECQLPSAVKICETILRYWQSANPAEGMHAQAAFHELLALLIEGQVTLEALARVKAEIDHYYSEDISIDRLAALSGTSRYHLMRMFKERYDKSIVEYIREVRLHHAKQLMLEPERSIGQIASQVGFQSEHYFRTVFKKQVGIAPAIYLRNRKRRIAAYSWPILGQLLPLQTIPYTAPLDHYWTDEYSRKYSSDVVVPLGHNYEFNRNALLMAKPACIIGLNSTISPEEEAKLNQIAPVLLLPWMENDWRTHLRLVGDFLNLGNEAEQWQEQYDRKAAMIRESVRSIVNEDKILVLKIAGGSLFIWGREAMTVLYDDLQLTPASHVTGIKWYESIDLERLSGCDADRIVVNIDGDAESQELWHSLQRSEHWKDLKATRKGTIHIQSGHPSWVYPWTENTALNHERFLDAAQRMFLCAQR